MEFVLDFKEKAEKDCNSSAFVVSSATESTKGGCAVKSIETLRSLIEATKNTQESAAALVGWTKQQLNSRMIRGDMKTDDWLALIEAMGIDIVFVKRDTGESVRVSQRVHGVGPRAKGMSDRIRFDTEKADALANSFYIDGEHRFTDGKAEELYVDDDGRYFIVVYSENGKSKIQHVTGTIAAAFIEKFGARDPSEE